MRFPHSSLTPVATCILSMVSACSRDNASVLTATAFNPRPVGEICSVHKPSTQQQHGSHCPSFNLHSADPRVQGIVTESTKVRGVPQKPGFSTVTQLSLFGTALKEGSVSGRQRQ